MNAILYTLIPAATAVGTAILAARNGPSERFQTCVQHFAAGIIFAAVATQLLPPILHEPPVVAVAGFLLGIVAMIVLRHVGHQIELRRATLSAGLVTASFADVFVDGVVVGATFVLGTRPGILLTIALTLALIFLALSVAAALSQAGAARSVIVLTTSAIALAMPLGAALGVASLQSASPQIRDGILAFGSVVLMYLVTEELLVRAHKVPRAAWAMPLFFLGFLIFLVLAELAG